MPISLASSIASTIANPVISSLASDSLTAGKISGDKDTVLPDQKNLTQIPFEKCYIRFQQVKDKTNPNAARVTDLIWNSTVDQVVTTAKNMLGSAHNIRLFLQGGTHALRYAGLYDESGHFHNGIMSFSSFPRSIFAIVPAGRTWDLRRIDGDP